jgi:H+/Cl- antiporter ClcA
MMPDGTTPHADGGTSSSEENTLLLDANWMEGSDGGIMHPVRHYHYGGTAAARDPSASGAEVVNFAGFLPRMSFRGSSGLGGMVGNNNTSPPPPSHLNHGSRTDTVVVVVAPAEVDLPSGTPLLGSSKLAAMASSNELRRSLSASVSRSRSASMASRNGSFAKLRHMVNELTADHDEEIDIAHVALIETVSNTTAGVKTLEEIENYYRSTLGRTQTTFYEDAMTFAEGSIPQSIAIALVIGCVCGLVAYLYYSALDFFLTLIWKDMPNYLFVVHRYLPDNLQVLWIPLVTFTMSAFCGLSIYLLGEPGDLAYTIKCIHEKGYKATHHILPMIASSMFTILAGASLGPEAPLVAICAATAGFISRRIFKQRNTNVLRKHTFMGMAGALSAFFGVPLGGSIFALEVTSRFGVEYFEHLIEAIFAGEICVAVFRSLAGLPLGSIWRLTPAPLSEAEPYMIILGGSIGLLGAGIAYLWAIFHWRLTDYFRGLGLMDDENRKALPRVMCGAFGIVAIGMFVPQTMFWGEFEFPVLATASPASDLPHVWPTAGLVGFEMNSFSSCVIVGTCKLVAISFTVAGGFRGGFIFPFFSAGAAFGRALCFAFPTLSPSIATLCLAAGINVAITRTAREFSWQKIVLCMFYFCLRSSLV